MTTLVHLLAEAGARTVMRHQFRPNPLKRREVEIFESYGEAKPPAGTMLRRMSPIRSSRCFLLARHRVGMRNRPRGSKGFSTNSLSSCGRSRLMRLQILRSYPRWGQGVD